MHVFIAVLLVAVSAFAIAHPPGPTVVPAALSEGINNAQVIRAMILPFNQMKNDQNLNARYILSHYIGFKGVLPRISYPPRNLNIDWLDKEIEKINEMVDEAEALRPYISRPQQRSWGSDDWTSHIIDYPQEASKVSISYTKNGQNDDGNELLYSAFDNKPLGTLPVKKTLSDFTETTNKPEENLNREKINTDNPPEVDKKNPTDNFTTTAISDNSLPKGENRQINEQSQKKEAQVTIRFALTPTDKEYFENIAVELQEPKVAAPRDPLGKKIHHEGGDGGYQYSTFIDQRSIRQNPNLSKQKHLLEPDLSKLQSGLANKDYRMPVSLLPTNLQWLKAKQEPAVINDKDDSGVQDNIGQPRVVEVNPEPNHYLEVLVLFGFVVFLAMGGIGVIYGCRALATMNKMAADVDYPAYGVTGPSIDNSGDRKLAHSAHMYHYQHQKQQIIAMERNDLEQRTGSISDNESEEENEEGDYTVYEFPGFATTGDMEVKNPLFSEDTTPATPGKCQVVKPQPEN